MVIRCLYRAILLVLATIQFLYEISNRLKKISLSVYYILFRVIQLQSTKTAVQQFSGSLAIGR